VEVERKTIEPTNMSDPIRPLDYVPDLPRFDQLREVLAK
jgi:hypothetical protein